ncbi:MAG: protoheme IX farnesyltransferase [Acidobacteria bacterium]|nr:protoheme IX farnesyltransferase [Acidobacteriota bacterium]MBV9626258.1 protoheme IX farnesyltransferase [Acidobacteriota bacterium]
MKKSTAVADFTSKLRDYYILTKPEVNLLIVMATSTGFCLASPAPLRVAALVNTLCGTLLVASGTATFNQWMEREKDGRMRRTMARPLPAGRLSSREAFLFGLVLSVGGGVYLAVAVNGLSSLLAISALLSYLMVYTPLKQKTPWCTLLGAFPGAMPTLIGWAGARDHIEGQAWFLFAIVFLWQFPHFLAIALMYRQDYARAGFQMLPRDDQHSRFARVEILAFTIVLVITALLPAARVREPIYLIVTAIAGALFLYPAVKLAKSATPVMAGRVVRASVLYLPIVLAALIAEKV